MPSVRLLFGERYLCSGLAQAFLGFSLAVVANAARAGRVKLGLVVPVSDTRGLAFLGFGTRELKDVHEDVEIVVLGLVG
eukprot:4733625-Amphidinium_carterae.1